MSATVADLLQQLEVMTLRNSSMQRQNSSLHSQLQQVETTHERQLDAGRLREDVLQVTHSFSASAPVHTVLCRLSCN